jgi:site-specific DNA-methyltransferase (adenine-specific)
MPDNQLFYGDNLDVLRRHVPDESVDLIYLDPPFKSNQDYNILFKEKDGTQAAAQIQAFEDTWEWDTAASRAYEEIVQLGGKVSDVMQAFKLCLGGSDMLAYLAMMAPRLVELSKALKSTGSIYLHCDPAASHYLKMLMDAVFGPEMFRSEIIWRRTGSHNSARRYGPIHDVILFYVKTKDYTWNKPKRPYMKGHVTEHFVEDDKGWRTDYYGNVLTGSGTRNGESGDPWHGFDPTAKGRHWAIPRKLIYELDEDISGLTQHQKLDRLLEMGLIKIIPGEAWPMYQHYVTPADGVPVSDLWTFQPYTGGLVFGTDEGIDEDVRWLSTKDQERLHYPTQKPVSLLERIIKASSNAGDTVLDPFCGCGTTIEAAHKLGRTWIGIDITHLAIGLIKSRLRDAFGQDASKSYTVLGEPTSLPDAQDLADSDPFQFQCWALGLVGARKANSAKKGADRGIDGKLVFEDNTKKTGANHVIISVKSGSTGPAHVRDLLGVVDTEKAAIGVLITMDKTTKPMRTAAAGAGFYHSPWTRKDHAKIQILTVEELLDGNTIDMPPHHTNVTFKKAKRAKKDDTHRQATLDEHPDEDDSTGETPW